MPPDRPEATVILIAQSCGGEPVIGEPAYKAEGEADGSLPAHQHQVGEVAVSNVKKSLRNKCISFFFVGFIVEERLH
jgi:hypothetical protein